MYLLLGHDTPVRDIRTVAVIDMDGSITTPDTADFLRAAEKGGITRLSPPRRHAAHSRRKRRTEREEVLFSTLSSAVLLRRSSRARGGF